MIVAILASVFRGAEEAKRRNNQRSGGGPDSRRERPPRSESSGIDQFLEEIRRRQAARQESARASQRESRSPPDEETPPPLIAEAPPPEPPPPRRRREVPVLAVAVEAPNVPVVVADIPAARPVPTAAPVVLRTVDPVTSAVRDQLAALLRTKPGLRTAVLLHEVFGEPKCRQRR